MMKTAVLSALSALIITLAFPAAAQDKPVSEIPEGGPKAPAAAQAPVPVGAYNVGVGPINLRPGAYINRNGGSSSGSASNTTAGRKSYPLDKPATSAAAYNKSLVTAKQSAARKKQSLIPSPFPSGF